MDSSNFNVNQGNVENSPRKSGRWASRLRNSPLWPGLSLGLGSRVWYVWYSVLLRVVTPCHTSHSSHPSHPSHRIHPFCFFCVQFHSTEIWNAKTLTQKHRSFARFALYSLLTQTWHEWKPLTQQHGYFHGFPGISPSTRTIDLIDLMSHRNFETTKISENQSENQVVKEKQVITVINEWSTSRRCNPSPACSSKCPTTSTNST